MTETTFTKKWFWTCAIFSIADYNFVQKSYCYNFFDQQNKWEKVWLQLLLQTRDSGLLEEIQCQKKTEGGNPYNYAGLKKLFK